MINNNKIYNNKLYSIIEYINKNKNKNNDYYSSTIDKIQTSNYVQLSKFSNINNHNFQFDNLLKKNKKNSDVFTSTNKYTLHKYNNISQEITSLDSYQKNCFDQKKIFNNHYKQIKNFTNNTIHNSSDNNISYTHKNTENINNNTKDNNTTDTNNIATNKKTYNEISCFKNLLNDTNEYNYTDIDLGINLFQNYQNIIINYEEPVLYASCILLYNNFLYLNNLKKKQFIKELKYIMAIDLDKKDLYNKFSYNHKKFKKTSFQNDLINNKIINNNYFYMYLGDYFGINFIIKNKDNFTYCNNYIEDRLSLLLFLLDNNLYIHYNCDNTSLVLPDLMNKMVKKIPKNNLNNLKILDLQNIAKSKNIDIKKHGKNNLINKTKKELIQEINSIE